MRCLDADRSLISDVMCPSRLCVGVVENVKEVLKLTLENKNGVVTSGELTVILDGLAVDQEPLHNGNAATTTSQYNLLFSHYLMII